MLDRTAEFGTNFGYFRKLIRPNRSLSRRGLRLLLVIYVGGSMGIGLGFGLAMGAWLILPFVGLEIAVIAAVLAVVVRRAGRLQIIDCRCRALALDSTPSAATKLLRISALLGASCASAR